ncbi:PREDICTED: maspardin-like [Priapulus caudatus]|uniref:Maspardin n=1 Tax=Priapulus caudatus TaxID=37621 RepID=A0ABM1EXQ6_PRICU|nr:PREDICTED: maspardin-like [Priapulus caudatus]
MARALRAPQHQQATRQVHTNIGRETHVDRQRMADISRSREYQSFRSTVPQKKLVVDDDDTKEWKLFDSGPRSVACPLLCLPPASGTADIFYKQIVALTALGYRVIAAEYPVYWNLNEWNEGLRKLLDYLKIDKVHIFGASLGGFLAQKFAEYTFRSPRVASIVMCNSFTDTSVFEQADSAPVFWLMPALVLKKMVMGNFNQGVMESEIANSIDFMVEKLDGLSQQQLSSRLTLNCMASYIEPQKLKDVAVTIMDVFDDCALTDTVRDETYKCYPEARRAHLKGGGNFPFLSRSAEVNLHLQIHLRQFSDTKYSANDADRTRSTSATCREEACSSVPNQPHGSGH